MGFTGIDRVSKRMNALLDAKVKRARELRSFMNTTVLDIYKEAQVQRFESENRSETGQWKELNKNYLADKKVKYANSPGGGNAIMIASGALSNAAIGRDSAKGFKKVITTRGMVLSIDDGAIPYAKYAVIDRDVMVFGSETIDKIRKSIKNYMDNG